MARWLDALTGSCDLGGLWIWKGGSPFTVSGFATGPGTGSAFADYTGSRNIGGISTSPQDPAFTTSHPPRIANFAEPVAGTYGTSWTQHIPGAGFFNVDTSLVKRFAIADHNSLTFRSKAYNLLNKRRFRQPVGDAVRCEGRLRPNQLKR